MGTTQREHIVGAARARVGWQAPLLGLVIAAVATPLMYIVVSANSPAPTAPTTGTMVVNGNGTETLTVRGSWSFPAQSGDCNTAKRAAGYAVDWNDVTQPGNAVGTVGPTAVDVGAASANARNPADNAVHPTPVTEFPAAWGGCGTFNVANNYNSGTWGPISHTYPSSAGTTFNICVVTYDVHLTANGGQPKDTKATTAGGGGNNGDNSVKGSKASPAVSGCQVVTVAPPLTIPEAPAAALLLPAGLLSAVGFLAVGRGRRSRSSR